jgi:uncharacterized protein YhaN
MRILRLQLHEVGRHQDLDLELASGFTIIRGPNEAGKSTVHRAIELALFRRPTGTGAELDALRRWGAGDSAHTAVRLEFSTEDEGQAGDPAAHRGVLEKEFRGQRGSVRLEYGGETITDPARAEQVIAELTGIPTEAFFRSTASIRHEELNDLDRDEGALRDRLQASIGGGDRGSSRAKARLEDAIKALKARGEKNPGRLRIAEEAVAQAEGALRAGEAALERLERDRDALAKAREARLKAELSLGESRNMLEGARQAERLRTDKAVVAERFERYRQAADAQQRLRELEAQPERSISGLRDSLDKMRTLQGRVSVLQETLREERGPDVEPDEPELGFGKMAIATLAELLISAVVLAFGLATGAATILPATLGLLVGLGLVYFTWDRRSVEKGAREHNQAREHERALRRQRRVGTEEGLRVAESGVQNILRELGVHDVASAERLLSEEQTRRQEIATLRVQVAALLAGQTEEGLSDLRDRASLELEQKQGALQALGPIATDARAREQLEAEAHERQDALEHGRDSEAAAQARLDANPIDAEQVAGEAERLVTWQEQLAALRRRLRIYEATLAAVGAAESTTMGKATRFLEQYVGRDIARLTGGRYRRVTIDDRTLDMQIWSAERGDWIPAGLLSRGTVDQIYLAARIGLVRLITQGRRPPLVMDDPFVTFDDTRAARASLLLRELATDFQVIYLACSSRYDGLADAVVELPGPSAETEGGPADEPAAGEDAAPAAGADESAAAAEA